MPLTTVTGRVRATARLKADGHAAPCVLATTWASDRAFPRTAGTAIPFELEAGDGAVYRVDPFEATVALPVRRSAERTGVRREEAWIAVSDEITVEGQLDRPGGIRLRAHRIAATGAGALHRLPPRTLQKGESERLEGGAPRGDSLPASGDREKKGRSPRHAKRGDDQG